MTLTKGGFPARDGESQDLCFIAAGRYHELLRDRAAEPGTGRVLDTDGLAVGSHKGHYAYTIGQRFGHSGKRYYVIEKRAATNEIVIAERERALKSRITVGSLNLFLPLEAVDGRNLRVKYRYNSSPVAAEIVEMGESTATFQTDTPCFAPAPGQILACYRDDCLILGGIIESSA